VHSLYSTPFFDVTSFQLFSSRPLKGGGPYAVEADYTARRETSLNLNMNAGAAT
jgi:hypothetical protein